MCLRARGLLQSIATRLTAAYDLKAVGEDLLKELYQELVDPQTRHDLGEFYTPDWLAELTLRRVGFPPAKASDASDASLFDPSCGSGTFLFTAVRLLRESGLRGKRLVEFCVNHLAGVDVHPLAVSIAKTNLLLALGDDLKGHDQTVGLPVFLADSLSPGKPKLKPDPEHDVIPIFVDSENIAARAKKAKPRSLYAVFEIPVALADQPHVLHDCLDALLDFANPQIDKNDAAEGFRTRLRQVGVPSTQWHRWASNLNLMRWLLEPPTTNNVWRFVLNNAYQPELLARRKFAFVVGNPPWLSYRYIKRADYQQRVRQLVFDYRLVDKRRLYASAFGNMELATLFFAFCADRYLANRATIAFVMPRSILTGAKQHRNFREQYVSSASFIIDCEHVTPLFNVPACVLSYCKVVDSVRRQSSIPSLDVSGTLPNRNTPLSQAKSFLTMVEKRHVPLEATVASDYLRCVFNGAKIDPRCLWFVSPPSVAQVINTRQPQLETDPSIQRKAKVPWKGLGLRGSVEAEFLFATLLSEQMVPFGWRRLSLVILPLLMRKGADSQLLDVEAAVRDGRSGLAEWLRRAEKVWFAHRKTQVELVDRLDWLHNLTRQNLASPLRVLYNASGTNLCACTADNAQCADWRANSLPIQAIVADSKTYYLETTDPQEAHYLCALLNAPRVDKAIKPFQTKGAFGAHLGKGERDIHRRPFEVLPIARFDGKSLQHRQLAELSRHCHEKVRQAVAQAQADGDERFFTTPIGRLRPRLRKELLASELSEIDALAGDVLGT